MKTRLLLRALAVACISAFLYAGWRYTRPADDPLVGTWYNVSDRTDRWRVYPNGNFCRLHATDKILLAGTWKSVKTWSFFPNTFNPGEIIVTEEELRLDPKLQRLFSEGSETIEIPYTYALTFREGTFTVAIDNGGQGLWSLSDSRGWLRPRPWTAKEAALALWEGKPVAPRWPGYLRPRPHRMISF